MNSNYTISMMFRSDTVWRVYTNEDAITLIKYAKQQSEADREYYSEHHIEHYSALYVALMAQHESLDDNKTAFPEKIIARFDQERKQDKKAKEESSLKYVEIRSVAFKECNVHPGSFILDIRLRKLGAAK